MVLMHTLDRDLLFKKKNKIISCGADTVLKVYLADDYVYLLKSGWACFFFASECLWNSMHVCIV